jgi:hypothetical protein
MPTEADWKILGRLFAGEPAAFRHHLGLSRSSTRDFYAPTGQAASIRAEKQAILASADSDRHLFDSAEGLPPWQEFIAFIGCGVPATAAAVERGALNRAATLALEPDCILLADADWKLVWASVCFPTRWSLADKGLQPLSGIHAIVPGLNAELGRKIDVFFGRLEPGEGWGRANWGLSTNAARNQHPSLPYSPLSRQTLIEEVYVRVESQHLLKLPATGAIAFGIRILNFPLAAVADHPDINAGLKERLRTMPGEVAAYKGIPGDFWLRL